MVLMVTRTRPERRRMSSGRQEEEEERGSTKTVTLLEGLLGKEKGTSIISLFPPLLLFFILVSIPHPGDVFQTPSSKDFIILLPEGLIPV